MYQERFKTKRVSRTGNVLIALVQKRDMMIGGSGWNEKWNDTSLKKKYWSRSFRSFPQRFRQRFNESCSLDYWESKFEFIIFNFEKIRSLLPDLSFIDEAYVSWINILDFSSDIARPSRVVDSTFVIVVHFFLFETGRLPGPPLDFWPTFLVLPPFLDMVLVGTFLWSFTVGSALDCFSIFSREWIPCRGLERNHVFFPCNNTSRTIGKNIVCLHDYHTKDTKWILYSWWFWCILKDFRVNVKLTALERTTWVWRCFAKDFQGYISILLDFLAIGFESINNGKNRIQVQLVSCINFFWYPKWILHCSIITLDCFDAP